MGVTKLTSQTQKNCFHSHKKAQKRGKKTEHRFFREIACLDCRFIKPKYVEQSNSYHRRNEMQQD
ncbi:MAG: hypothetical protein CW691_08345 [Candidatus Bathyarchaeum sp.]|nr:MAG: hypothetical protein CW691_08345 [Candidatus Bathyarchaeum sp.]